MRHRRRHCGKPHGRRLRTRIFVWFGISILLSGAIAGSIMWAVGGGSGWTRYAERVQGFVGGRFAEVWDDPVRRDRLAESVARDLEVGVVLIDDAGGHLARYGPACHGPAYAAPVVRDGRTLGRVEACVAGPHEPGVGFVALLAAVFVLWGASGAIAWRLTRPLVRLVDVARELGDGRLDSRVRLHPRSPEELQVVARAVNDMAARIEKQLSDQRELLATVSHEIRTPLGHARVLMDLAREQKVDARIVAELEREILAIDALVDRLLARSRLDFGAIDRRSLDAVQLAITALERGGYDPTLLEVEGTERHAEADPALLLQALANLLRNADEHGAGVVRLGVRLRPEVIELFVDDAGPGFAGDPDAAFGAFFRGDGGGGSLGLGLALVRRIARAHGGDAWAENRPQNGARVGMRIARAKVSDA